ASCGRSPRSESGDGADWLGILCVGSQRLARLEQTDRALAQRQLMVNSDAVQRNVRSSALILPFAENVRRESLLTDERASKDCRAVTRRVFPRHGCEHEEISFAGNALLELRGDDAWQLLA